MKILLLGPDFLNRDTTKSVVRAREEREEKLN
jgi:hypothetical protein